MPKVSAVIWDLDYGRGWPKSNEDGKVVWRVVQSKSERLELEETVACMQQESSLIEFLHDYPVDRHVRVRSW